MEITSQSSLTTTYTDPDTHEDITETKASNVLSTTNMSGSVVREKTSTKTTIKKGEQVSQDNTIRNNSTHLLSSITFTETLSEGASFVAGTVELNGVVEAEADPTVGIPLTDLNTGEEALITYSIKLNDDATVENVTSSASIKYTADGIELTDSTNALVFAVVQNLVDVVISADKTVVIKGGTIHYTVNITNKGTLDNKSLTFTNPIPTGTTFVAESVKINDTPDTTLDPATGFALPNLAATENIKVEFDVTVS